MDNRTYFFYTPAPQKGEQAVRITVAGIPQADGTMKFGVARCTANDPFNKQQGRAAAEGRAKSRKQYFTVLKVDAKDKEVTKWFVEKAKKIAEFLTPEERKNFTKVARQEFV